MSLKNRTIAAVAPFAHLLGLARAEDEDTARKGKGAKGAEEDDQDKKDEDGNPKGKRAEEDDQDKKAEGDDKEKDDKSDSSKAKSKAEEDDKEDDKADEDDSDEEMRGTGSAAAARRRERARCKAIFSCDAAGVRPDVAATLAFNTTMSRSEAVAVLTSTAAGAHPARAGLADRMAVVKVPQAGAGGGADLPAGMGKVAAAIVAAGEKARAL